MHTSIDALRSTRTLQSISQVQCTNCSSSSKSFSCSTEELFDLEHGKGKAHVAWKCSGCGKHNSAHLNQPEGDFGRILAADSGGKWVTVATIDARGLAVTGWDYADAWSCSTSAGGGGGDDDDGGGSDKRTEFKDFKVEDGEWYDVDADNNPVSIQNVKFACTRVADGTQVSNKVRLSRAGSFAAPLPPHISSVSSLVISRFCSAFSLLCFAVNVPLHGPRVALIWSRSVSVGEQGQGRCGRGRRQAWQHQGRRGRRGGWRAEARQLLRGQARGEGRAREAPQRQEELAQVSEPADGRLRRNATGRLQQLHPPPAVKTATRPHQLSVSLSVCLLSCVCARGARLRGSSRSCHFALLCYNRWVAGPFIGC